MKRLIRFWREFKVQRSIGWSLSASIRNSMKRTHPKAKERYEAWLQNITKD